MAETLSSERAWSIDPDGFPFTGSAREQLAFLVRYAVLAPSGHNTQPWRFILSDTHVDVVADTSRALHMVDPHDREMIMSCAAAAETLLAALRAFGLTGTLMPQPLPPVPDIIARVTLLPKPASGGEVVTLPTNPGRRHRPLSKEASFRGAVADPEPL